MELIYVCGTSPSRRSLQCMVFVYVVVREVNER